jgi:transposase InsO family protein
MPRIGTRKLYFLLKEDIEKLGIKMGRDTLFNFLRAENLLVKNKRCYIKTTNSKHWMRRYPNLISTIEVSKPEQLWVSDITYIKTKEGHHYLSLITDAYSKKIMGYALLDNLGTDGPLAALKMALKNRKYEHELIHHSDRGLQYCSAEYTDLLKENAIKISMTQNGDPYENAIAERVNGTIKNEMMSQKCLVDHFQAIETISESISIYNERRPHLSCNMLTPLQMHDQDILPVKRWKKRSRHQGHRDLE